MSTSQLLPPRRLTPFIVQHPWGYIHHPTPSQKAASRAAIAAVTAHQDARLQAIRLAARGGCGPLPPKVMLAQEQKIEKPKEMAQVNKARFAFQSSRSNR